MTSLEYVVALSAPIPMDLNVLDGSGAPVVVLMEKSVIFAAWNTGERRVPRQYCLMEGSLEGLLGSGTVVKEENCRLHCQGAEWSLEQVGMRKVPAHKILIIFYVDEKNEDVFVRSIKHCRGIHPRPSQCGFSSYCRQEPALLY